MLKCIGAKGKRKSKYHSPPCHFPPSPEAVPAARPPTRATLPPVAPASPPPDPPEPPPEPRPKTAKRKAAAAPPVAPKPMPVKRPAPAPEAMEPPQKVRAAAKTQGKKPSRSAAECWGELSREDVFRLDVDMWLDRHLWGSGSSCQLGGSLVIAWQVGTVKACMFSNQLLDVWICHFRSGRTLLKTNMQLCNPKSVVWKMIFGYDCSHSKYGLSKNKPAKGGWKMICL